MGTELRPISRFASGAASARARGASLSLAAMVCCLLVASAAPGKGITLSTELGSSALLANQPQKAYLKVGLTGFPIEDDNERAPVNLAIVLDKSGSMQGEKIAKAREAAIMAISRLQPDDIVSVITYDSSVRVVVPATKVSDKETIFAQVRAIGAGGSTALFAGVSKGAQEIRKFLSRNRVNRVVLLSDGLANVGPQTPAELGRLGASLGGEGITVSTIGLGLGYNEDLMTQLASHSDGSHFFAENATDLARIFNQEFGLAKSVVAQKIIIEIRCEPGIRPVRVLGQDAEIAGNRAIIRLNRLYSEAERLVILEIETPATEAAKSKPVASVDVRYLNMASKETDRLSRTVAAAFTTSQAKVEETLNEAVMVDVVEQIAVDNNTLATKLRDQGKVEEAQKVLFGNNDYLLYNGRKFDSQKLLDYGRQNVYEAENLDNENWQKVRKQQREDQISRMKQ